MAEPEKLVAVRAAAFAALENAYAPYSKFRVGAALLTPGGEIIAGCNVENSAYPSGMCAERVAVGAAVSRGLREFTHVVVATEAETPTPPLCCASTWPAWESRRSPAGPQAMPGPTAPCRSARQ